MLPVARRRRTRSIAARGIDVGERADVARALPAGASLISSRGSARRWRPPGVARRAHTRARPRARPPRSPSRRRSRRARSRGGRPRLRQRVVGEGLARPREGASRLRERLDRDPGRAEQPPELAELVRVAGREDQRRVARLTRGARPPPPGARAARRSRRRRAPAARRDAHGERRSLGGRLNLDQPPSPVITTLRRPRRSSPRSSRGPAAAPRPRFRRNGGDRPDQRRALEPPSATSRSHARRSATIPPVIDAHLVPPSA